VNVQTDGAEVSLFLSRMQPLLVTAAAIAAAADEVIFFFSLAPPLLFPAFAPPPFG